LSTTGKPTVEARLKLLPTELGGLRNPIPSGSRSLLLAFARPGPDAEDVKIGAVIDVIGGSALVPGGAEIPVNIRFWADEAAVYATPGVSFTLWYGHTVGTGVVTRVGADATDGGHGLDEVGLTAHIPAAIENEDQPRLGRVTPDRQEARVPDSELDFDADLIYRWRGKLFTGVGFEIDAAGGLSEVRYRFGVQEGVARDWYPSGVLKGESYFHDNVNHGATREFAEDGSLIIECLYEYGILVERRERNKDGELAATFTIDAHGTTYSMLERYRREKGWPTSG
jgi:hypothetical protein